MDELALKGLGFLCTILTTLVGLFWYSLKKQQDENRKLRREKYQDEIDKIKRESRHIDITDAVKESNEWYRRNKPK